MQKYFGHFKGLSMSKPCLPFWAYLDCKKVYHSMCKEVILTRCLFHLPLSDINQKVKSIKSFSKTVTVWPLVTCELWKIYKISKGWIKGWIPFWSKVLKCPFIFVLALTQGMTWFVPKTLDKSFDHVYPTNTPKCHDVRVTNLEGDK